MFGARFDPPESDLVGLIALCEEEAGKEAGKTEAGKEAEEVAGEVAGKDAGKQEAGREAGRADRADSLLLHLHRTHAQLDPRSIPTLHDAMAKSNRFRNVRAATVNGDGVCSACGDTLPAVPLTAEQREEMSQVLLRAAEVRLRSRSD